MKINALCVCKHTLQVYRYVPGPGPWTEDSVADFRLLIPVQVQYVYTGTGTVYIPVGYKKTRSAEKTALFLPACEALPGLVISFVRINDSSPSTDYRYAFYTGKKCIRHTCTGTVLVPYWVNIYGYRYSY